MNETTWATDRRFVLAALDRIEKAVESLDHTIHGNDQPGLKGEVAALKTEREGRQWRNRMVTTALVSAVVISTFSSAVFFAKWYALAQGQGQTQGR